MREEAVVVLKLDNSDLPAKTQQAGQALASVGAKAEASLRQTQFAMRQLPAQFTDIFTSLAGGQNPLLVLIQQGGQIRDSFGSVGGALRGVASAISPLTVGVGAAAGAVLALGAAALQGTRQMEALRDVVALTGNSAGLTADRLALISERVAENSRQTLGASREIVLALARTGQVSSGAIGSVAQAVARLSDVTGQDAAKISADFASMSSGVAKWAAEHNKAWNFITVEQYRYIRRLEEQGKAEEAQVFVAQRITERLEDQRKNLGLLETAWDTIAKTASGAWDAMLGLGRESTTRQQLDIALERLNALPLTGRAREAAEQRVQFLKEQLRFENQLADSRSRNAARNREAISDERDRQGKPREFSPAIIDSRAKYRNDFLRGEKSFYDEWEKLQRAEAELVKRDSSTLFDGQVQAYDAELKERAQEQERRLRRYEDYLDQIRDANDRAAIELIDDERARGEALIRLDREIAERRLADLQLSEEQRATLRGEIANRSAIAFQALDRQLSLSRRLAQDFGSALSGAFEEAVLSGNSLRDMLSAIGNDLKRILLRRLVTEPFANFITGQLGNVFGGLFGRASGGPVAAGVPYVVGERGRELFVPQVPGRIVPSNQVAGSTFTFAPVINVNGSADTRQIEALLARERVRAMRAWSA